MSELIPGPDGEMHMPPAMPVTAYKTYSIFSPPRPATCEEVGCPAYLHGWKTIVPADSPQAAYIQSRQCGRAYTRTPLPGGLIEFMFEAGQMCFAAADHRLPWDGRERFTERGGDWRGVTSPVRQHSPQGWTDAFGEHQQRLAERLEHG